MSEEKVPMEDLLSESRRVEREMFQRFSGGAVHKQKGVLVTLQGVARDEDTLGLLAVYTEEGHAWVKPLHEFQEKYRALKEET